MSTLYGWSVDSFYGIDHTYVTSSDGHVWPCWGRSSGGQVICSGTADASQADCLSQKNSRAGILYGLTGVCHQTANRILYPARCIVSKATNYWITAFLYGTYGLSVVKFKSRLAKCLGEDDYHFQRLGAGGPDLGGEVLYLQRINQLYTQAYSQMRQAGVSKEQVSFRLLQNELKLTVSYRLGSDATLQVSRNLQTFQLELLKEKNYYDRALMARRLKPADYATKVNNIINSALKDVHKSLGESRYQKMFGIKPDVQLIDPAIMQEFYRG